MQPLSLSFRGQEACRDIRLFVHSAIPLVELKLGGMLAGDPSPNPDAMPASLVVHVEDTPADESEHGRAVRRETAEVTRSKASATAIWQMRLPPMTITDLSLRG